MINISFTEQELNALVQMLDLAVKAGGLNVAGAAFMLQQKLAAAVQATQVAQVQPDTVTDKVD